MVEVRPTTPEDVEAFVSAPLDYRIRAWTGLVDGRIIAIGGVAYLPHGVAALFMHSTDEARRYPVALHKAGRRMVDMVRASGATRIRAMPQPDIERAAAWLERLGFRRMPDQKEEVYELCTLA
jgi:hypothetical protein